MKPMLLFLCMCLLHSCSSQEISEASPQTFASETPTATQNSQWDTTPTAHTTLQSTSLDTRTASSPVTSRTTSSDHSTLFNNPWGPMLMPMQADAYGSRMPHRKQVRKEHSRRLNSKQFDTDAENLAEIGGHYPKPSEDTKYSMEMPFIPVPPTMFHPSFFHNDAPETISSAPSNNFEISDHNASASTQTPWFAPNGVLDRAPLPYMNPYMFNPFMYNPYLTRNPANALPGAPFMAPPGLYDLYGGIRSNPANRPVYGFPRYGDRDAGTETAESPREVVIPSETVDSSSARTGPQVFPPNGLTPFAPFPIPPPVLPVPYHPAPRMIPPSLIPPPQVLPVEPNVEERFLPNPAVPALPEEVPVNAESADPRIAFPEGGLSPVPPANDEKAQEDSGPFVFGFDSNDGLGTMQHRHESSDANGVVRGSYGFKLPDNLYRLVNYISDKDGFRVFIKTNEPGTANPGSADAAVMAEPPPPSVIVDTLRRSGIEAAEVPDLPPRDIEVEAVTK